MKHLVLFFATLAVILLGAVTAIGQDENTMMVVGAIEGTGGYRLAVEGDLVYIGNSRGMSIVTIADPNNPIVVGSLDIGGPVGRISVVGDVAYLPSAVKGLVVADISDKQKPTLVDAMYNGVGYHRIIAKGRYAFGLKRNGELEIFDVGAPPRPVRISKMSIDGQCLDMCLAAGFIYMLLNDKGVAVIDVSDVLAPRMVSEVSRDGHSSNLAVLGTNLAVGSREGAALYDISNPEAPELTKVLREHVGDVFGKDNTLFVAWGEILTALDITNVESPAILGTHRAGYHHDAVLYGEYVLHLGDFSVLQLKN